MECLSYTEMSYASIVEHDTFSTLNILVEGEEGSVYLGPEFEIRTTTRQGTTSEIVRFPSYSWADPDYIVNHESGIHVNRNILEDIKGGVGKRRIQEMITLKQSG